MQNQNIILLNHFVFINVNVFFWIFTLFTIYAILYIFIFWSQYSNQCILGARRSSITLKSLHIGNPQTKKMIKKSLGTIDEDPEELMHTLFILSKIKIIQGNIPPKC